MFSSGGSVNDVSLFIQKVNFLEHLSSHQAHEYTRGIPSNLFLLCQVK